MNTNKTLVNNMQERVGSEEVQIVENGPKSQRIPNLETPETCLITSFTSRDILEKVHNPSWG